MKYRTYNTVVTSFVEAISGLRAIIRENPNAFGFRVLIQFDNPRP
jgi:hypothetical protein